MIVSQEKRLLKRIAKLIGTAILAAFALLGYVFNVRSNIELALGLYSLGLIDGGLVMAATLAILFYLYSGGSSERNDKG